MASLRCLFLALLHAAAFSSPRAFCRRGWLPASSLRCLAPSEEGEHAPDRAAFAIPGRFELVRKRLRERVRSWSLSNVCTFFVMYMESNSSTREVGRPCSMRTPAMSHGVKPTAALFAHATTCGRESSHPPPFPGVAGLPGPPPPRTSWEVPHAVPCRVILAQACGLLDRGDLSAEQAEQIALNCVEVRSEECLPA
eukprot:5785496-Pleurochrysis_carterae.AAC.2